MASAKTLCWPLPPKRHEAIDRAYRDGLHAACALSIDPARNPYPATSGPCRRLPDDGARAAHILQRTTAAETEAKTVATDSAFSFQRGNFSGAQRQGGLTDVGRLGPAAGRKGEIGTRDNRIRLYSTDGYSLSWGRVHRGRMIKHTW